MIFFDKLARTPNLIFWWGMKGDGGKGDFFFLTNWQRIQIRQKQIKNVIFGGGGGVWGWGRLSENYFDN